MDLPVVDTARRAPPAVAELPKPAQAQFLTFSTAGESYAMPIAAIKEIIEHGQVTPIPLMPEFIRGVINLRGAVVPVIDLSARLGQAPSRPGRRTCIVIVEMACDDERLDMGLVVDGVSEVVELGAADLEEPPSFGARVRADFIEAMARIRGRFVIVMRLDQVLSLDEVAELSRLGRAGRA